MAGTYSEQITLANDNTFIGKVRVALIFRANQLYTSATAQTYRTLAQANTILGNAGADAPKYAFLVATANPTIAAAAPAVPSDGDTQYAVNTILSSLL